MPIFRTRLPASWQRAIAVTAVTAATLGGGPGTRGRVIARTQIVSLDVSLFRELTWRPLGPSRSGRVIAADGASADPAVFYVAAEGGGLWKTTDYGLTWQPIFDTQAVLSIGAIAVAPSRPDVIYAGTGDDVTGAAAGPGNGLYRSPDAGRTWVHTSLPNARATSRILVHPADPNRLLVALVAPVSAPDAGRGVFRSADGGATFDRVLIADNSTGATDLAIDATNPDIVFAAMAGGPVGSDASPRAGASVFKSVDGGSTWRRLTVGAAEATSGTSPSQFAIAVARSRASRVFVLSTTAAGNTLYRSDDAGETWAAAATFEAARGDDVAPARTVTVDPQNADVVYVAGSGLWRSTDGGQRFLPWAAAATTSVERLWIDSNRPRVMLASGLDGPHITVNSGQTWSAVESLPTAGFAHVSVDTAFPYRVCGTERHDDAICLPTRTETGVVTQRDWTVVPNAGGDMTPDPADPDVLYTGHVMRFDRRTGQLTAIGPPQDAAFQTLADAPLVFSTDGKSLYYGANALWKLTTLTQTWLAISPDLTRAGRSHAAISTIGVSSVDPRTLWAGTSDGLVHLTRDAGLTWTDVTPPSAAATEGVLRIDASHFDAGSAYLTMDHGADGEPSRVLRTRDGGASWVPIVTGLPQATVSLVREDAYRRGLLFAATGAGVQLSFDDGDSWQSLRQNMPAVAVTDLVIKDADVVVSTAGRGFWMLEDISALRQITADVARADAFVFRPATGTRLRASASAAGPIRAPEEPSQTGGIPLHYLIGAGVTGPVILEVIDSASGTVLRRFASDADDPATRITATPGLHRVFWDARSAPLAVPGSPAALPVVDGIAALPGVYQVRLTAGSRTLRQAVSVRLDPRLRVANTDLTAQYTLAKSLYDKARDVIAAMTPARPGGVLLTALQTIDDVLRLMDRADARPTAAVQAMATAAMTRADGAIAASR